MNIAFLLSALALVSALISLSVEAIKKVMDSIKKQYNSTLLAVIMSIILSVACSIGYVVYCSIAISPQVILAIIAFTYLSFLCATLGYDKVIEIFKKGKANE